MPETKDGHRPALLLRGTLGCLAMVAATSLAPPVRAADGDEAPSLAPSIDLRIEVKSHLRHSEDNRFPVPFSFGPSELPAGQDRAVLETANEGTHLELSVVTLLMDAEWSEALAGRVKLDVLDLYDRNPTSTDREIDVDEAWLRFGRETPPAIVPETPGRYVTIGKIPKFERQDDRHLESYGLVSTAFNRFEDIGLELGVDLGPHLYVKGSLTQGNPVFMRDPNALAGDNGTPGSLDPRPGDSPRIKSGIPILYDAEVEGIDTDGDPEIGLGLGWRRGAPSGDGVDLLLWGYRRELADTVELEGTRYGGDLDLLLGPFDQFPFPVESDEKEEVGLNVWGYWRGATLFVQLVDQDLAGLDRTGWELELAWRLELPLRWALAGRQLFPSVQPALRHSALDNGFGAPDVTPSPSFAWDWDKTDVGVRLEIVGGVDLTAEWAFNRFVLGNGSTADNDEGLVTLRWLF